MRVRTAKKFAIDLGTTYTAVYIWTESGVEVVTHDYGKTFFPSSLSVKEGRCYVGRHSKTDDADGFQVIHNVKRVIGRDRDDGSLMDDIKKWNLPYKLDEDGRPYCDIGGKKISAIEITALFFLHAKKLIKDQFGEEPSECVVTVPSYFTSKRVQATKDAGRIAGLKILRIISEPGAVAISALHSHGKNGNYLVFDVGGGTTDWAILSLAVGEETHDFAVIAAGGNNQLGGEDCLHVLTKYFSKKIPDAASRYEELRSLCEAAKNRNEDPICIRWDGKPYRLTQAQYKVALRPLLSKMETLLELDSWTGPLDGVILAGGACQQRQINELAREKFKRVPFLPVGALPEAVARGAAWSLDGRHVTFQNGLRHSIGIDAQAGRARKNDGQRTSEAPVVCSNPPSNDKGDGHVDGGIMEFIIRRNESLPTSDSIRLLADSHETRFRLYEGEHLVSTKNISLGIFWILAPVEWFVDGKSAFDIEVTVTSDMEITVDVTATDGLSESLVVKRDDNSEIPDDVIEKFQKLALERYAVSEGTGNQRKPQKKRKRKLR